MSGGNKSHSSFCEIFESVKSRQKDLGFWTGLESSPSDASVEIFDGTFAYQLRNYQKAAVKWMIGREKDLAREVKTSFGSMSLPRGGILADEMGLGKTLEILSLIFAHPRSEETKHQALDPIETEEDVPLSRRKRRHGGRKVEAPEIFKLENGVLDKPTVPTPEKFLKGQRKIAGYPGEMPGTSKASAEVIFNNSQDGAQGPSVGQNTHLVDGTLQSVKEHDYVKQLQESHQEKNDQSVELDHQTLKEMQDPGEPPDNKSKKKGRKRKNDDSLPSVPEIGSECEVSETVKEEKGLLLTPSPKKKGRHFCKECDRDLSTPYRGSVSSVSSDWRKNKDKVKRTIQSVIDNVCGKSDECVTCVKRERSRSLREARESYLQSQLAAYSTTRKPEPLCDTLLHCVCGGNTDEKTTVQCPKCHKTQHPRCMNYDLKDPFRGEYICPVCWDKEEVLKSKATLIVTPASISYQWIEEFEKHVKNMKLKMLVYKGVHNQGYIQPVTLASFDIVITTYEVLRKELNYANLKTDIGISRRRRSNVPSYMSTPTPLTCVEWWRTCLDEAQMVEGEATKAAEMARRLLCINRWCVTGTPIQKSIKDLSGLFSFLGIYEVNFVRFSCFEPSRDLELLVEILSPVLWRTMKKDVLNQVHLPPQKEVVHWLTFSPVEDHFYFLQHNQCSAAATRKFETFDQMDRTLSSIDRHTLNALLFPLLRLRQACCHPQMVRGEFISLNKNIMTMEQLLEQLVKKTTVECEDAQRILVSSLNGLAGIDIIKEFWNDAAEKYREVLRIEQEMRDRIKMDTLQRLHAVHNLSELLSAGHKIPPTLRDSELPNEAEELKKHYMRQHLNLIETSSAALGEVTQKIGELMTVVENMARHWWLDALEWCETNAVGPACVQEVKKQMREQKKHQYGGGDALSCLNAFKDSSGLQLLLHSRVEELMEQRKTCLNDMRKLQVLPLEELARGTSSCHLRPTERGRRKKCELCIVHEKLIDLESLIFRMDEKKDEESEVEDEEEQAEGVIQSLRKGTWHDSETLIMIRAVASFLKKKKGPEQLIEASQNHVKALDFVRKEFLRLRRLWRFLSDQVAAQDELQMATLRLRLRLPGESLPPPANRTMAVIRNREDGREESRAKIMETIHIIQPYEVEMQRSKLEADLAVAKNNVKKKLGKLYYLKSLEQAGYGKRGALNPEPCPVCQMPLGTKWSVLLCGHSYCVDCLRALKERNPHSHSASASITCPYCRQLCLYADISYVYTGVDEESKENSVEVKGSHSTKVEAVVREMLLLKDREPDSKVLIFSTWEQNLIIISRALEMNGIEHCFLGTNKFQENLYRFKHDPNVKTLLLSVNSGANGLNLIEANHVFLFEPILNPASELQAIGRVHRIGQTRQTLVHRFLVKNTIEEKMHQMLSKHQALVHDGMNTNENPITVGELHELFTNEHQQQLE